MVYTGYSNPTLKFEFIHQFGTKHCERMDPKKVQRPQLHPPSFQQAVGVASHLAYDLAVS